MTIVMVRRRPVDRLDRHRRARGRLDGVDGSADRAHLGLVGSIVWVAATQLHAALDRSRGARHRAAGAAAARGIRMAGLAERPPAGAPHPGAARARGRGAGAHAAPSRRADRSTRRSGTQARLAEGRLRDEMRGPRLLDDAVHAELERARRRGANVTVLDEGGLDGLDEATLAIIRAELAETLRSARSDRLYIRTSPDDRVAVTVVGRSATGPGPVRRGRRRPLARDRLTRGAALNEGSRSPSRRGRGAGAGSGVGGGEGRRSRPPLTWRTVTRKPSAWPNLSSPRVVSRSAERKMRSSSSSMCRGQPRRL